jgi:hypothetical protein
MRQPTLWTDPEHLARAERWEGLDPSIRSELVAQLVHIVVEAVLNPSRPQGRGRTHGLEDPAEPPGA